jgi:hypothetical protein
VFALLSQNWFLLGSCCLLLPVLAVVLLAVVLVARATRRPSQDD